MSVSIIRLCCCNSKQPEF